MPSGVLDIRTFLREDRKEPRAELVPTQYTSLDLVLSPRS